MEIDLAYELLLKALLSLDKSFVRLRKKQSSEDPEDLLSEQDSCIHRFEICYDGFWKLIKKYLEKQFAVQLASPREIFKECFVKGLCSEQEAALFIDMIATRNLVTHTYSLKKVYEIMPLIPKYHAAMNAVMQRLKI